MEPEAAWQIPGSPQNELPQCRFCLEEGTIEEFITPCKCEGTSRFVHESCLRRWQTEALCYEHSLVCQVCRSCFTVKPVEKLCRGRSRSSEDTMAALFDNVRTNPRYDREVIHRLPRSMRSRLRPLLDSGCLVLQTPQRARDEAAARRGRHQDRDNVMVFFEAVLASRMAHWHKGIYLLAAKWTHQGTDGSDALVGVNLAGARADVRRSDLEPLQVQMPDHVFQCFMGGPVGPDKLLALVPFEGELQQPLTRLVHLVGAAGGQRALFGELRDVAQVLSQEANLGPMGGAIFQGHAVWSSDQLMSEVARGSWGLARAHDEDLRLPFPGDPEVRWAALWELRDVVPDSETDLRERQQTRLTLSGLTTRAREASGELLVAEAAREAEEHPPTGPHSGQPGCLRLDGCIIS